MKHFLILVLVAVLASSCSTLQPGQNPASNVDTQATIDAIVKQSAEQTLAAQPSPTAVPPTDTATPVIASSPTTEVVSETTPDTPTPSSTPIQNLTTTPATATSGPADSGTTATATLASGVPTLTPTLGILKYGTLPPAVPSAKITIVNKSKRQAYISLQNRPPDKEVAFLEYPVEKQVKVSAPLGYYLYVVWVGGRKIIGEFRLHNGDDITITIYKDKVEITE